MCRKTEGDQGNPVIAGSISFSSLNKISKQRTPASIPQSVKSQNLDQLFCLTLNLVAFASVAVVAVYDHWSPGNLIWGFWAGSLATCATGIASSLVVGILRCLGGKSISYLAGTARTGVQLVTCSGIPGVLAVLFHSAFFLFFFAIAHFVQGVFILIVTPPGPEPELSPQLLLNEGFVPGFWLFLHKYWVVMFATLVERRHLVFDGSHLERIGSLFGTVLRIHLFLFAVFFIGIPLGVNPGSYSQGQEIVLLIVLFVFFFPWRVLGSFAVDTFPSLPVLLGKSILLVIFALPVGAFVAMTIYPVYKVLGAVGWEQTECTIVSSELGHGHRGNYFPTVTYHYTMQGRDFTGNRRSFDSTSLPGYFAEDVVAQHPVGSVSACYVNRSDSTDSVMDKSLPWSVVFGVIPLIIGYYWLRLIISVSRGGRG